MPPHSRTWRSYAKWCADNLETPFTQKKFSQYLFKNAEQYGIRFSMRIEGGFRGNRGAYFCIPRRKILEASPGAKQGRPLSFHTWGFAS